MGERSDRLERCLGVPVELAADEQFATCFEPLDAGSVIFAGRTTVRRSLLGPAVR